MWLLLLLGCLQPLHVSADPVGAVMKLPDGQSVALPADVSLTAPLFTKPEVRVSAPGYRTLVLQVRRLRNGPWLSHSNAVHIVLVPEHGPSGTWTQKSEGL